MSKLTKEQYIEVVILITAYHIIYEIITRIADQLVIY
jgi:hypothetical protein